MSTVSDRESSPDPEGARDSFKEFIEERYGEWEREFGDDVNVRRTASFDPKN
ncbi:hypothetical protein [Mycolicibacterium agri]|uniref:Uncharacterized protein n=1 Tax=Mycolicibacterium agri TaxID=36811 RepID=A0A7I9W2P1_MYCAG|nr:hypothetical protein [Mycolicibacterium agri]GFG51961.1 hypothetical protein MAGR_34020 [Mycolicibacterium agri]